MDELGQIATWRAAFGGESCTNKSRFRRTSSGAGEIWQNEARAWGCAGSKFLVREVKPDRGRADTICRLRLPHPQNRLPLRAMAPRKFYVEFDGYGSIAAGTCAAGAGEGQNSCNATKGSAKFRPGAHTAPIWLHRFASLECLIASGDNCEGGSSAKPDRNARGALSRPQHPHPA
jgi:hypothetical protein